MNTILCPVNSGVEPTDTISERLRSHVQGSTKQTVVVAGASGFIGRRLPDAIGDRYKLVGLSRDPDWAAAQPWGQGYEWRRCDLFSRRESLQALEGAHRAVYLVHSMNPSTRLRQGYVRDMDVVCADNFARAARHHGLTLVVHPTGLAVGSESSSHHLASLWEVDQTLRAYGTAVTTIRAGLVVGSGGSATEMIQNLVRRLPVMGLPRWTEAKCAPIARRDLTELIAYAVGHEELAGQSYDVEGPQNHTFRQLLELSAGLMGVRRRYISLPAESPRLSTLWVSIFGGQPRAVVRPLVETFRYGLEPSERRLQDMAGMEPTSISTALAESLRDKHGDTTTTLIERPHFSSALVKKKSQVRSIQRLELPGGRDARWVANEYARWLPRFMGPFINVKREENRLLFCLGPTPWPLLVLELDEEVSRPDRQLYWIRGGLLAAPEQRARLEFRQIFDPSIVLTAIHGFRPRLPWVVYRYTQAVIHRMVIFFFGRHLQKLIEDSTDRGEDRKKLNSQEPGDL